MGVNTWLAAERGLSENTIERIDFLHALIENLIKQSIGKPFSESVYTEIEGYEYLLQQAWGFPKDCDYHTWKKVYKLKNQWCGKKFRCKNTGETFTIPYDIKERDTFYFGDCFIDLGRVDCYSRRGGPVEELKEDY